MKPLITSKALGHLTMECQQVDMFSSGRWSEYIFRAREYIFDLKLLESDSFQMEVLHGQLGKKDTISIQEKGFPYVLFIELMDSLSVRPGHEMKMIFHERGANVFSVEGEDLHLILPAGKYHLIILLRFSKALFKDELFVVGQLATDACLMFSASRQLYSMPRIVNQKTLQLLSHIIQPPRYGNNSVTGLEEAVRALIRWCLQTGDSCNYQAPDISMEAAAKFYQQRRALFRIVEGARTRQHLKKQIANFPVAPFSEMLGKLYALNFEGFLLELQMTKALALLRNGRYDLVQVAKQTGFTTINSFRQCFIDHFGYPPEIHR